MKYCHLCASGLKRNSQVLEFHGSPCTSNLLHWDHGRNTLILLEKVPLDSWDEVFVSIFSNYNVDLFISMLDSFPVDVVHIFVAHKSRSYKLRRIYENQA